MSEDANSLVTITKEELQTLRDAERMLNALEGAGVDNWVGYEYAMEIYHGE